MSFDRTTAFGVGLFLAGLAGYAAIGGEGSSLCVNGHPAPRASGVTYGGLSPKPGYQRDHRVPLCLGGPDAPGNVRYQPIAEARVKDREEWALCEAMCAGKLSLEEAIQQIEEDWP